MSASETSLYREVLVQIFVTPLGSNNNLYPIINNLFLVIPFLLWIACDWFLTDREQTAFGFAWKAPLAMLLLFVFVQGIGFHQNFVFQDGMQGERRTMCITAPAKAANVYTGQDNGELLQELAVFVEKENLNGRDLITYGELPGMGYLLDMPSGRIWIPTVRWNMNVIWRRLRRMLNKGMMKHRLSFWLRLWQPI